MNFYLISLLGIPQVFPIQLSGINYIMTVRWNNAPDAGWEMDLTDSDTGTVLATCIPFVAGANLLSGLDYLGIGGDLYVNTQGDPFAVPTYTNLGTLCNLYYAVTTT